MTPAVDRRGAGEVEVVFADLAVLAEFLDEAEQQTPRLSEADYARIAVLASRTGDQANWRRARIALRIVIERWAGPQMGPGMRQRPFMIGAGGRPRLDDGLPAFSHSHSGTAALIAVAAHDPIGIDIEALRPLRVSTERRRRIEIAAARLAPDAPLPGDETLRFLQAWVRLEASAKATGAGIGQTLTNARVIGSQDDAPAYSIGTGIAVRDIAVPLGFLAAVATAAPSPNITLMSFPADAASLRQFLVP